MIFLNVMDAAIAGTDEFYEEFCRAAAVISAAAGQRPQNNGPAGPGHERNRPLVPFNLIDRC